MIAAQVAKKYANALFLSTRERGLVEQAYGQFGDLKALLEKDPSLTLFLSSPKVEEEQKIELVRTVFGGRFEKLFVEFLVVLVEKRRAGYLIDVIDEFNRLVEFERGIARVTVHSAIPLSSEEEKAMVERLAAKTGRKIELEKKVDPAIIGGVIIVMHDEIIDGSIKHGLDQLEEKLQHIKVH